MVVGIQKRDELITELNAKITDNRVYIDRRSKHISTLEDQMFELKERNELQGAALRRPWAYAVHKTIRALTRFLSAPNHKDTK